MTHHNHTLGSHTETELWKKSTNSGNVRLSLHFKLSFYNEKRKVQNNKSAGHIDISYQSNWPSSRANTGDRG